jgi:hypothetical protein
MNKAGAKIFYLPFAIEVTHFPITTRFSFVACGKWLFFGSVEKAN